MTRVRFVMEEKYTLSGEGLVHETPEALAQMQPYEIVEVLQPHFDEDWMAEMYESGFGFEPGVAVFSYEIVDAVLVEGVGESDRVILGTDAML